MVSVLDTFSPPGRGVGYYLEGAAAVTSSALSSHANVEFTPSCTPSKTEISSRAPCADQHHLDTVFEFMSKRGIAKEVDSGGRKSASEESADVWEEAIDPLTRRKYFYNALTRERQWTDPTAEGPSKVSDARGWRSAVDASTGKTYYYNTITRKTTWTKPESASQ